MVSTTPPGPDAPRLRLETHHGRVVRCFAERPDGVDAMFRAAIAGAPDGLAVIDGGTRITYRELDATVEAVVANLAQAGVAAGDRVALLLDNRPEFLALVLACARMGAVAVPMNIRQRRPETEFLLNDCGAAVLAYEADLAGELPPPEAVPDLRRRYAIGRGSTNWAELCAPAPPPRLQAVGEDEAFCILYTSGTTGRPKGAILTHCAVVHSCLHYQHHLRLKTGDRALLAVPASHVTGLVAILMTTIRVGGATLMMRAFKARRMLEIAAAERMAYTLMVPAMYSLCLLEPSFADFDLSAWRVGGFGGAPMPEAVIARLAAALPRLTLFNAYGATETASPAVIMPAGEIAAHGGAIGLPVACCDLAVMDDDGREVAAGESGEVWLAGPMVVPGYWRNPAANADAFTGGWWKSGDIGSRDQEGFLSVFDRKKDMINRGGFKVYSVEVENVLMSHPAVVEAAVVGRPCPVLGERVEAFVTACAPVDADTLRELCAAQLSDYKVPEHIRIGRDPLPRNPNGKLLKAALRQTIAEETEAG
jgi:long-chain acyl-CoA synthetase